MRGALKTKKRKKPMEQRRLAKRKRKIQRRPLSPMSRRRRRRHHLKWSKSKRKINKKKVKSLFSAALSVESPIRRFKACQNTMYTLKRMLTGLQMPLQLFVLATRLNTRVIGTLLSNVLAAVAIHYA